MHFRQSFAGDPDSWIKVITPDNFSRINDKDKDRDKVDTIDNDNNREVEYKEVGDKKVEHKKVKYKKVTGEVKEGGGWVLDQFTKTFFWNFQSIRADLSYILIYKQMLEKVFCSNIAPSLSSGNHLFYKAEYMGQSCPNQVWAITFDWSALAT